LQAQRFCWKTMSGGFEYIRYFQGISGIQ